MMEAVQLREVDKDYRNHLQAFLNFAVKAERKAGRYKTKPVYQYFKKFYDRDKAIKAVRSGRKAKVKDRYAGIDKYLKGGR